jgi:hypothetical protein
VSDAAPIHGVSLLPRSAVGRRLVRIRVRWRRSQLDAALAHGADPWSAPELMVRASRLGLLSERRRVAAALHRLVASATLHQRVSPVTATHYAVVLQQRDSLLALAERIFQPEPVKVAVIAQLALLVSDTSEHLSADASQPGNLADVTARCLEIL